MKICVYQYSTENAYCKKLLLICFLNLLLFLSLYIDNSERIIWILDGKFFLFFNKWMQFILPILAKGRGYTYLVIKTYLIHEMCSWRKQWNVDSKKLRRFVRLYIGWRFTNSWVEVLCNRHKTREGVTETVKIGYYNFPIS